MLTYNSNIPLFPLNVVLFPGMMLPLYIFEERYKTMTRECLGTGQPFGVVLAKTKQTSAVNANGMFFEDLYHVGTTAQITAVEHLQDGRMNLIAVGQDRFVIKDIELGADDLLIGRVDPFPIEDDDPQEVDRLAQKLRPIIKRYIGHLADASGEDLSGTTLPNDPTTLAFLAGTAIQGPLPDKQKLLSAESLRTLIADTVNILDREDQILAYMLRAYQAHQEAQRLPFVDYSLN
ncbi:MAG: LON peptidase substrate-binding domain-containing protein [Anaerolineae bacterium]|nr:LON peptidase substrate-binding domain-containing protein [Anaerolineae bacterium]